MRRMTIVWRIARHDFRSAWRNRAVAALALALTLLAVSAAIVGQARFDTDAAQRHRYQQMVGEQFRDQPDRHPHRVSHYGFLVFRPRAPLGFFDSGVESYGGTSIFLEAHRQNGANFSPAGQGGSNERFGELTLALVLQMFLPLFVFVVAGVAVTREREAGTLPLLSCQGVSWGQVLWGKVLGALLIVTAVLMPGLVVSLLWVAVRASTEWTTDLVVRAGVLAVAHAVFLAACAVIAVIVSAWHRTSRSALITLMGIWLALWIVLPRVLPAVGAAWYPLPSRAEFDAGVERQVRALGDSHNPNDPKFAALRSAALAEHGVSRIDDLPFNYSGFVMQEGERHTSEAYQAHMSRLLETFDRQSRLVDWAALVSPYLGIRALSMGLSGSDAPHLMEFDRQAEAYRYRLIESLNTLHMNEVPRAQDVDAASPVFGAPSGLRIDRRLFDQLPAFNYEPPSVRWAVTRGAVGMATALASVVMLIALLVWTTRRPLQVS